MVNLSPTEESFYESLCSLRLAKQVNQCELGKPKRQLQSGAIMNNGKDSLASSLSSNTSMSNSTTCAIEKRKQTVSLANQSTTSSAMKKPVLKK
jgi:hypothetical protein